MPNCIHQAGSFKAGTPIEQWPKALRYNKSDVLRVTLRMSDLTVTYESGVLKPAIPLAFPEGQFRRGKRRTEEREPTTVN
jgi:hypothetical protein